jgi:integrase
MAHYTIRKRFRADHPVFCASVIQKNKGKVIFSKSKTHASKTAATKWAKSLVHQLEINEATNHLGLKEITLGDLIREYMTTKAKSNRPLGRTAIYCYRTILNYPVSELVSSKLQSHDIVQFCLQRKNSEFQPSAATISIDVSLIRKVLRIGKSLLGVHCFQQPVVEAYQALYDLKLIGKSAPRSRRLENNEYDKLIKELSKKADHHCNLIPYVNIFKISLLTCLRISEVTSLQWGDLDLARRTILVRDRKNPNGSADNNDEIPLLGDALEILLLQPRNNELIFPFNSRSITAGFRRTCKKIGIKGLRYHDLRREGATLLIEAGYSIEEVATVTGHKDLSVLWKVYTRITPDHLVAKGLLHKSQ